MFLYVCLASSWLLVLFVLIRSLRIANQYERGVVFRLGKYNRTAGPGIYIVWFLIEWQTRSTCAR